MRLPSLRTSRAENANTETTQRKDLGLKLIEKGLNPVVDIVAVHGLNGHRDTTWTAANGKNWLSDFLPKDIPNSRIWSWGYDANTHSRFGVSHNTIWDHGEALVGALSNERELSKTSRLPIIFIAHDLGGIVVKSALIYSNGTTSDHLPEHHWIKACTYGIMFMGTPHQGVNGVKAGRLVLNMASLFMPTNKKIIETLQRGSEWLEMQNEQYLPISKLFVTHFAYEEYETKIPGGAKTMIVPRFSAVIPGMTNAERIVIHADHREMVRFESKSDDGYRAVSTRIFRMTEKASELDPQWAESTIPQMTPDGPFTVTFGIPEAPESECFVGRDQEISQIGNNLRHAENRRTVVLYGLGGMGKTQLARNYANI
ncbi:uncharacterized protein N7498_002857 [Penicillium cinerascens]|uniref:DUF676 domain-containing protein n=1 Tax=Penicillium cinerascens TaxID=70096 RepID=A0A9W9NAS5_9EURO|nr:uncharacterized protein N7498_002857 [Penicillium cinerascens]KAJ5216450.1 hypothetical protein N7498_002857 [Penicillium cinerascens]